MVWFLVLAAGLWFLGWFLGAPASARWMMIGLLYVAVLALLVIFPEGSPLQRSLGGSLGEWLVLGALALVVFGYGRIVGRLKAKAAGRAPAAPAGAYAPGEVERYARHIMLREIGGPGQKALKQAKVLVVGAGGLGSPALMYLAAAGVGRIGVIDADVVEATNLQRQIAHADARIGMPKVFSAEAAMRALNPYVDVRPYHRRMEEGIARELVADYDLVLDGTDNFATRYLVNRACVAAGVPLISGALTQWEGQLSLFDPAQGTPCYECVFPEAPAPELVPSCAEAGVLGPLPGVVGAMMAAEAVKEIAGAGQGLGGRMLIFDALWGESRVIGLKRRAGCPVCGG
ncbi:HesA/MoeB/ThiF family protein [Psychromarinibacter sp. C21-152]|uniref:Molybdopterin-synthase adenylyltransferase n=1 Tax=Psychromarinibacter sediminicola TaxID=3033385 RepID=A0AAE3NW18_9RHOB|nr:HesA/MoeB/ThiF family protein [Psychromarinibacter sediminicola]MDF0601980.1 HesA/MoeB/ThiF family protein [Psychromarinibacter sediminicola]